MFHAIADRKVRRMFQRLSEGDYESALEGLAPRFEHTFAGDHALGGTRHTVEGFRAWFERLFRLFPNLDFEVGSVAVSGPPWDLTIVAEWIDRATPAGGGTYENRGVHVVRLAWGKLTSVHAYLDTRIVADALRTMAANGIEEASALPIVDAPGAGVEQRRTRQPRRSKTDVARLRSPGTATPAAFRVGRESISALAVGAVATGALAVGALAIGSLAIGKLTLGRARIRRLEIDDLIVRERSGPIATEPATVSMSRNGGWHQPRRQRTP